MFNLTRHIGITGTRLGMTLYQAQEIAIFIRNWNMINDSPHFHHGDCVGVDAQSAKLAKKFGYVIEVHPASDPKLRAFTSGDIVHDSKSYLERNRDIVRAVGLLLVVPANPESISPRSGTWYTKRYAEKNNVPYKIFLP